MLLASLTDDDPTLSIATQPAVFPGRIPQILSRDHPLPQEAEMKSTISMDTVIPPHEEDAVTPHSSELGVLGMADLDDLYDDEEMDGGVMINDDDYEVRDGPPNQPLDPSGLMPQESPIQPRQVAANGLSSEFRDLSISHGGAQNADLESANGDLGESWRVLINGLESTDFRVTQSGDPTYNLMTDQDPHFTENSDHLVCLDEAHVPKKTGDDATARFLSAAQRGDMYDLRQCFWWCVPVDAVCDQGANALHYASYMGRDDVVSVLLDNGANAYTTVKGTVLHRGKHILNPTPLRLATVRGNLGVVSVLLEKAAGVSTHAQQPYLGVSEPEAALPWALCFGYNDIASKLIHHGARLDIKPCLGYTGPGSIESLLSLRSGLSGEKVEVAAEFGLRLLERILQPAIREVTVAVTGGGTVLRLSPGPQLCQNQARIKPNYRRDRLFSIPELYRRRPNQSDFSTYALL